MLLRIYDNPELLLGSILFGVGSVWVSLLSMGALARTVSDEHLGETPSFVTSYGAVLRRLHSLAWGHVLIVLIVGGVLIMGLAVPLLAVTLIVIVNPGPWGTGALFGFGAGILVALLAALVIFIRLLPVSAVIIHENLRGRAALRRTWDLTRRNLGRGALVLLLGALVALALALGLEVPARRVALLSTGLGVGILSWAMSRLGYVFALPLVGLSFAFLYWDARARREGLPAEMAGDGPNRPILLAAGASSDPPAAQSPVASPAAPQEPTSAPPIAPAASAASRKEPPPQGFPRSFKVCPKCGSQVPPALPMCRKCGTRVPYNVPGGRAAH
jgi:hypothetical protein